MWRLRVLKRIVQDSRDGRKLCRDSVGMDLAGQRLIAKT